MRTARVAGMAVAQRKHGETSFPLFTSVMFKLFLTRKHIFKSSINIVRSGVKRTQS